MNLNTSPDKQYLLLRTNYSLSLCLIEKIASTLNLVLFSYLSMTYKSIEPKCRLSLFGDLQQPLTVPNMSHFTHFTFILSIVCSDKTIGQQKDKQKDNHYLLCLGLFTTNAEIHQIGAVSPGLHC